MGSRVNSRYSQPGMERLEGRRVPVDVGRVDISSMPWTFNVKLREVSGLKQTDQPPIRCQLEGAANLPVSTLFENICEEEEGQFMMIIKRALPQRTHLVKLLTNSNLDVARYLEKEYGKQQMNLAAKLPQYERFFNCDYDARPKRQNREHAQTYSKPMIAPSHRLAYSSSSEEPVEHNFVSEDNTTFTSHSGPMYSTSLLKSYVNNQRKSASHVTGVPEMKCDPVLKPTQMRKRASRLLDDVSSSTSSRVVSPPIKEQFQWERNTKTETTTSHWDEFSTSKSTYSRALKSPYMKSSELSKFRSTMPKKNVIGTVTQVNSIDEFYVVPCNSALQDLEQGLLQKYRNRPFHEIPANWQMAAFAVQIEDQWFRAEITSVLLGHTLDVFLVDSGRSGSVPKRAVRILDKEDAVVLSKQAICCSLRGVWKKEWSSEDISILQELGRIEAFFVSSLSETKYSTIIKTGNGTVVNCLLGSEPYETLQYQKLCANNIVLSKDSVYEVKLLGPWKRQIHIHVKGCDKEIKDIEDQLKSISYDGKKHYFPRKGEYICVFENPFHRRAIISEVKRSTVMAFFIDFGYTKEISSDEKIIRPLPEHFLMKPAMAVPCLAEDFDHPWPRKAEFHKVKVSGHDEDFGPILMLMDETNKPQYLGSPTINKQSCDSKLAASFPNFELHSSPSKSTIPMSPTKSTVLVGPASNSCPDLQLATITHVQSPRTCFVRLSSKDAQYLQLGIEISKRPLRPYEGTLSVGNVCLAKFKGQWLRAEVLPGNQALFFDYGHRAPLEEVMHLEDCLKDISPAAFLCSVPPELQGLTEGKVVQVHVSQSGNKVVGFDSEKILTSDYNAAPKIQHNRKLVMIANYIAPWQVWLISELDVFQELKDRLDSQQTCEDIPPDQLKSGEVYACRTKDGWYRGSVDKTDPQTFFLIDVGCYEDEILQVKPLLGISKHLQPLATSFNIFDGDVSKNVDAKLNSILTTGATFEAQLGASPHECVLWKNNQNILELAGHMVRVEVSYREPNGMLWLTRMAKAKRRTEKLQKVAEGLEALDIVEIGSYCTAREMSDNQWYRAEVIGHTRLFHTVRLVDFGRFGEAVELKQWWSKEKADAKCYKALKEPADIGSQFLVVKSHWRGEKAAVYNELGQRVD